LFPIRRLWMWSRSAIALVVCQCQRGRHGAIIAQCGLGPRHPGSEDLRCSKAGLPGQPRRGANPRMNPMHLYARSVGLHLFQELSTLGQQLAHTLLFRQGCGGVKPMFPARTARPGRTFGGARSGTGTGVHPGFSVGHSRRPTFSALAGLGSAPQGALFISSRPELSPRCLRRRLPALLPCAAWACTP
jgi:hypothetical protein